jgi:hypothetical protein
VWAHDGRRHRALSIPSTLPRFSATCENVSDKFTFEVCGFPFKLHVTRAAGAFVSSSDETRLRITDIETVEPCLPALRLIDAGYRSLRLIRIHTDEGITGISDDYADPRISKAIIETPNIALDRRSSSPVA